MNAKTPINWPSQFRTTVTQIVDELDNAQRIQLYWKITLFYDSVDDVISQDNHRLPGMELLVELGEALMYAVPEEDRQNTKVHLPPEPDPAQQCIECGSKNLKYFGAYWVDESGKWIHDFECEDCDEFYSVIDPMLDKYPNHFLRHQVANRKKKTESS